MDINYKILKREICYEVLFVEFSFILILVTLPLVLDQPSVVRKLQADRGYDNVVII